MVQAGARWGFSAYICELPRADILSRCCHVLRRTLLVDVPQMNFMDEYWIFEEKVHAGEEHIDPNQVVQYDEKFRSTRPRRSNC